MMKKYELTKETIEHAGVTLHRIKRLSDGELGGFIESENNLSHYNDCWISDNALVYGDATVYGTARVFGNAKVSGNTTVYGAAYIYGNARVSDNARVYGNAKVSDNAEVFNNARVFGNAKVSGDDIATGLVQTCTLHKYNITMTDEHISMGCENHTIEYWKENIHDIGTTNVYTEDEINAIIMIITGMLVMRGSK